MCLITFAWRVHPKYPLILAANRDEFYARPAATVSWWDDVPTVLAGRDLEAGGTWLGTARSGRLAALTNVREPSDRRSADAPSRGNLPVQFLSSQVECEQFLSTISSRQRDFNGYNLLLADRLAEPEIASIWFSSNRGASKSIPLQQGIYGLSNAYLDTPWPKVMTAKASMNQALKAVSKEEMIEELLTGLADRRTARPEDLPRTGVPSDLELGLSAIFIQLAGYGTRASTVTLIDNDGNCFAREKTFDDTGERTDQSFSFSMRRP